MPYLEVPPYKASVTLTQVHGGLQTEHFHRVSTLWHSQQEEASRVDKSGQEGPVPLRNFSLCIWLQKSTKIQLLDTPMSRKICLKPLQRNRYYLCPCRSASAMVSLCRDLPEPWVTKAEAWWVTPRGTLRRARLPRSEVKSTELRRMLGD